MKRAMVLAAIAVSAAYVWLLDAARGADQSNDTPRHRRHPKRPTDHLRFIAPKPTLPGATAWHGPQAASDVFDQRDGAIIVASPACGTTERSLTLPERNRIPQDDQEPVRAILEHLRASILQRIPLVDGSQGPDASERSDDIAREGSIFSMRERWAGLSIERRRSALSALKAQSQSDDDFARDVRFINEQNEQAREELAQLLSADLSDEEVFDLWQHTLTWCSETLQVE